ncbi:hypothetical protein BpHYR1_011735 [Brachionus plicatilis]|uniref:Uncharacterized protein n=1 Tax=Brachionus plicatilis TaxID=10195 RepID=A0A3M7P941_BRAPC|nr:hypothetical protein BpHYR1_011735 [Brachionus plicatilis]
MSLPRKCLMYMISVWYIFITFEQRVHMMLFVSWMLFALDIQSSISPHKKTAFASLSQASLYFVLSVLFIIDQ